MNVYFTIDTESSMGGAWKDHDRSPVDAARHVFCRIGSGDYGVPLQVRILKEYGFKGTYFVETLATRCLGESDTASVFEYLLREGQDVQLHIHPTFHYYSKWRAARAQGVEYTVPNPSDLIGHFPEDVQMELLGEAVEYFVKFAGYRPKAFRAGCFAGSRSMLRSLRKLGIELDSSFNPSYHPELSFPDGALLPNVAQEVEGVWEIPVTVARTRLPEGYKGFKFADCTSLSFPEIREMLESAAAAGQQHFVVLFHSFSAVKTKDETFMAMRPNRIVIRRLERMFRYLAENPKTYRVETMGGMAGRLQPVERQSPVSDLGLVKSAVRKAVQVLNSPYWV